MCLSWTRNYECGCIWDLDTDYCPEDDYCWGRRMIMLKYNKKCRDCRRSWSERLSDNAQRTERCSVERQQHRENENCTTADTGSRMAESDGDSETDSSDEDDSGDNDEDGEEDEEEAVHNPAMYFDADDNCDLTRACDPVEFSSMWKDYRADRKRMDWYMLEGN
ncbi:hypothetical protein N7495_008739 [Penicillium taxi]|uniref:uncharacterized protein n=1 Tax=Penicillium taxi TaxID=168475 RepID=UPI0025456158|nr:uncharacterized protein N7495_008739 [Penicillium taxi]KAJ5888698.1 hypothetical protein N7495_008739 [Penicillium taxi]